MSGTPNQSGVLILKCPSCGANLEISADMEVLYCDYCGTRQIVERCSGAVALKLVSEAIARVKIGTDRTASELAIVRLRKELISAHDEWRELQEEKYLLPEKRGFFSMIKLLFAICLTILFFFLDMPIGGVFFLFCFIYALCTECAKPNASQHKASEARLAEMEQQLKAKYNAVKSEIEEHNSLLNTRNT